MAYFPGLTISYQLPNCTELILLAYGIKVNRDRTLASKLGVQDSVTSAAKYQKHIFL